VGQREKSFFFCTKIEQREAKLKIEINPPIGVTISVEAGDRKEAALLVQSA
jgi:hypothetical protein